MKSTLNKLVPTLAASLALLMASTATLAQVKVEDAWVAATVSAQKSSAAFMKLQSEQALTLVHASSPAAGVVELHSMSMDGDMMKMRRLDRLPLPAGQVVELQRSGNHLMVMDLKQQLKAGTSIPLTLVFEADDKNGKKKTIEQRVTLPVRDLVQTEQAAGAHKH